VVILKVQRTLVLHEVSKNVDIESSHRMLLLKVHSESSQNIVTEGSQTVGTEGSQNVGTEGSQNVGTEGSHERSTEVSNLEKVSSKVFWKF
jgi:hypothetical protein